MTFRADLRRRAAATQRRVVFAEADDARVRAAADRLTALGCAPPICLDPSSTDHLDAVADRLLARRGDRIGGARGALALARDPVMLAAGLVGLGIADAAVAGATTPTADVVRAALWLVGPAPGVTTVSSAFYMIAPETLQADTAWGGRPVVTFADAGVVPDPDVDQLCDIAQAAVHDRAIVVGDAPIVAFLSYATWDSADGPRVDKVRGAVAAFRARAPHVPADGPLQADAALVPEVAAGKAPGSPVAGNANVLVFPDLDSGNIGYKLIQRLAGAGAIGPVLQGLARPVADVSRGASTDDIVDVAAVAMLQSDHPSHPAGEA